jgi:lipopolysaccharide transport system ATP-binding protein
MNDIVIRVEKLGKKFHIGRSQEKYKTLRDTLADAFIAPLRKAGNLLRGHAAGAAELNEEIWALQDVSFNVPRGEVTGIIGRNGAGKSTLLKILTRITEPTTGYAEIRGRVGSLLEVGTGFHPELTGRENVFLNGAILGMRRTEIEKKFDEIVAFAEVEKFIDTPVKHYSSGMYLRLAFAVAAHLETEVLLVDEVLAVGDISFQKKCMGKMDDVAKEGRTVLFVSHNMGAVATLCTSVIWIDQGKIQASGEVDLTIDSYIKSNIKIGKANLNRCNKHCTGEASITDVRMLDSQNKSVDVFQMGETVIVEFDVDFYRSFSTLDLTLEVKRLKMGINVLHLMNHDCGFSPENIPAGKHTFRVELPQCMLYPTSYSVSIWVGTNGSRTGLDQVIDAVNFSMIQSGVTKRTTPLMIHKEAIFYIPAKWAEK